MYNMPIKWFDVAETNSFQIYPVSTLKHYSFFVNYTRKFSKSMSILIPIPIFHVIELRIC